MIKKIHIKGELLKTGAGTVLLIGLVFFFYAGIFDSTVFAAAYKQKSYASPDDAFSAMAAAMKSGNDKALIDVFGRDAQKLFSRSEEKRSEGFSLFIKSYEEKNRIERTDDRQAILHVGKEDWPWPVAVVKKGSRWFFDSQQGLKEILARRIGANETAAVQVCLAYVDAQDEYARHHPTDKGLGEYARKFTGDDTGENGLSLQIKNRGRKSPFGPLLAKACPTGRTGSGDADIKPYHGYFYKILTRQGSHASRGAYDYIMDGKMVGGFALVAYPALYGSTGIMTFIVNHDGVVYQKNLGKKTTSLAEAMTEYDPDQSWRRLD